MGQRERENESMRDMLYEKEKENLFQQLKNKTCVICQGNGSKTGSRDYVNDADAE